MSTSLTKLTELQAVNRILATVGEAPVTTLVGSLTTDVQRAYDRLIETAVELQTKGWSFNTYESLSLSPDVDGYILVPETYVRIDATDALTKVVERAGKLYDVTNNTFIFTNSLVVDAVVLLPYEELPQAARYYIMVRAARSFQDATLGDAALHQYTEKDEQRAWADFMDAEAEAGDYNVLNDSPSILYRRRNRA